MEYFLLRGGECVNGDAAACQPRKPKVEPGFAVFSESKSDPDLLITARMDMTAL